MTRFLFPDFRKKTLTFSYDDNTEQDRRLTCIFRFHRLPATFNINTGSFGEKRRIEHCGFYCDYVTAARSVKVLSGINDTGFDLFIEKDGEKTVLEKGNRIF